VVWRVALWYPKLVSHLFSVCTPYMAPNKGPYIPLETIVEKYIPTFGYQIQLASGEVEKRVNTEEQVAGFIRGIYNGRGPNGEMGFTIKEGCLYDNLLKIGPSPILSHEVCYSSCKRENTKLTCRKSNSTQMST
jgi:soluble epoxide hydrolase / lipid-phosphate phosphatase